MPLQNVSSRINKLHKTVAQLWNDQGNDAPYSLKSKQFAGFYEDPQQILPALRLQQ